MSKNFNEVKRLSNISVGDVYPVKGGSITVLEKRSRYEILIKHNDEHGHEMWTRQDAIEKGMVKNPFYPDVQGVGYIGVGKYVASKDYKVTEEYNRWVSMMQRGYSGDFKIKNPTYKDCTVCEEWSNFQVYAEWHTSQKGYGKGFDLDKDILIEGNKHYSPETCCLVPAQINRAFTEQTNKRSGLPKGVRKNISGNYSVAVCSEGKQEYVGTFKAIEEASKAYSKAKNVKCKELALRYKEDLDERVFLALMSREF